MSGVRLHHPTLAAPPGGTLTFVVELESEWANRRPRLCPKCAREHDRKAIHLTVDSHGDTIVSAAVLEQLRTVFLAGFEVANEVENPPTQYVGAVDQSQLLVIENRLNGHNPEPAYQPAVTKYESRDRLHRAWSRSIRALSKLRGRD